MGFFNSVKNFFRWDNPQQMLQGWDPVTDYGPEARWQKVKWALSNPAFVKVLLLNCDLFSLGKLYTYEGDTLVENDPLADMLQSPNYMQGDLSQWLWECMFWWMIDGNVYAYFDSFVPGRAAGNNTYILEPHKIEFPDAITDMRDRLILTKQTYNELMRQRLTYRYDDGQTFKPELSSIVHVPYMNTGSVNWFRGPSPILSLRKILTNTEKVLDSWNINARYSGKFLISGQQDPNDVKKVPLTNEERKSLENVADSYNDDRPVRATKSMVDIRRYIQNVKNLALPEQYLNLYFIIGTHYGIPKDVLEAFNSGTYENQEKATGKHISYSLQPKGNMLMNAISRRFGYSYPKRLVLDWEHLSFMQAFARDRAEVHYKQAQAFDVLRRNRVSVDSANEFLDTNFEIDVQTNTQPTT